MMLMMTACYLKDRRLVQVRKQDEVIDPEETFEKSGHRHSVITITVDLARQWCHNPRQRAARGVTVPWSVMYPRVRACRPRDHHQVELDAAWWMISSRAWSSS